MRILALGVFLSAVTSGVVWCLFVDFARVAGFEALRDDIISADIADLRVFGYGPDANGHELHSVRLSDSRDEIATALRIERRFLANPHPTNGAKYRSGRVIACRIRGKLGEREFEILGRYGLRYRHEGREFYAGLENREFADILEKMLRQSEEGSTP